MEAECFCETSVFSYQTKRYHNPEGNTLNPDRLAKLLYYTHNTCVRGFAATARRSMWSCKGDTWYTLRDRAVDKQPRLKHQTFMCSVLQHTRFGNWGRRKLIPVHTIKAYGVVEVQLHTFLISVLLYGRYSPEQKVSWWPLDTGLSRCQSWPGCFGLETRQGMYAWSNTVAFA